MKTPFNLFLLILLCSFSLSFSQEDYYGNSLNANIYTASQVIVNPTVQPPDVAAFQKSTFVPVSNYTGRTNISIPIYEISAGNISVPISLSYNSSGVKVADMASSVGLNWSLNAGGMISRMVKGMDDFTIPYKVNSPSSYMSPSGWLGYTTNITTYGNIGRYNDAEPDLFVVNAPGLSTKYIHKKHYNATNGVTTSYPTIGTSPDPIELESSGNIIDETIGFVTRNHYNDNTGTYTDITRYGLTNIEITSINGIVYDFATPDLSRHHSPYDGKVIYKLDSYRLDQMFDPSTNQTITFEYEQYSNYFADEIDTRPTSYGGGTDLQFNGNTSKTVYPYTQRLTKITFDKGTVEFIYGLNRLDNTGDKALTEIKVKDSDNNVIKHFKLSYTYFQSTIESSTPQSKRLRLDKVYKVDPTNVNNELPGHEFTYNTTYTMPPRDSYAHDFLGYNNGSYNSSISIPAPKYYFEDNEVSPFYSSSAIYLTGNYSLEANENYCKSYSLTKITFPTGGTNEYEYELNEFNYSGTKTGGGLRLKSQKITDAKGNEQILDYEYGTGYIANIPVYAAFKLKNGNWNSTSNPANLTALTSYFGIDTFMTPQSQVEFTQGAFVGYNTVTVEDRVSNGKTVYGYISPNSVPNISSTKTYNSSYPYSTSWNLIGKSALFIDNDFMRGKPNGETVYDKNNNKKLEKFYYYSVDEFTTLSLSHLNKTSSVSSNCYSSDGDIYYVSSCGGFTENIDLPIARHILTTAITYDYPEDPNNDPLVTAKYYSYDYKYPLVTMERHSNCEEGPTQGGDYPCQELYNNTDYDYQMIKEITYPLTSGDPSQQQSDTVNSLPNSSNLISQNRLSTPMEITFKNRYDEVVGSEDHYYKNFGNDVIALEKINFISRDNNVSNSEKITKRDEKGHIIEYQKRNGTYISRIYGYDNTYLIAEVENATYSSIEALSGFGTNFSISNGLSTSQETTLRNLSNAMVTTYTYNPLIGITSITDTKGYTTYYEYDEFNRLKRVKDNENKILSENEYHYKE